MASFFLPEGSVVVSEKQGKLETTVNHRSTGTAGVPDKTNIVVLVDNGSASASEILAGALKDAKVATVVGEKTFGKGSVQELINLSGGAALKVTTAKWYTPNGTSISEHGIVPDVESLTATSSPKLGKDGKPIDTQLLKAIEVVKQRK
jgi:carboxyl-terminal processing protease